MLAEEGQEGINGGKTEDQRPTERRNSKGERPEA
jgi:hypothetical protein